MITEERNWKLREVGPANDTGVVWANTCALSHTYTPLRNSWHPELKSKYTLLCQYRECRFQSTPQTFTFYLFTFLTRLFIKNSSKSSIIGQEACKILTYFS